MITGIHVIYTSKTGKIRICQPVFKDQQAAIRYAAAMFRRNHWTGYIIREL